MLGTCERHNRDHRYEFASEKCEVVAPVHRRRSHSTVKLCGTTLKEVHRYKYLGLPFGAKGLDTGRMCEVSVAKGICTASLFHSIGCNGGGFTPAVCRRVLTSFIQPSMEYGMALVNLRKGEQVALDKAWLQILRKTQSMPATASGSAILKVPGVPPMLFRASKLNAGFMARTCDAQSDTLTPKILSYARKGWGSAKRMTWVSMSEKNIHWSRIKETATPGEYRRAYSRYQWIGEKQALTGDARERQGSNGPKIRNVGPLGIPFRR